MVLVPIRGGDGSFVELYIVATGTACIGVEGYTALAIHDREGLLRIRIGLGGDGINVVCLLGHGSTPVSGVVWLDFDCFTRFVAFGVPLYHNAGVNVSVALCLR